MPNIV